MTTMLQRKNIVKAKDAHTRIGGTGPKINACTKAAGQRGLGFRV